MTKQKTDSLIDCPLCKEKFACYSIKMNENKNTYLCLGCGYQSNDLMKQGDFDEEQYEQEMPELYKDLKRLDEENRVWYPSVVNIQETVQNRTAQLALANYTILKIRVPGDTGLTAGSIINLNLPALDYRNGRKELDKFYSGKYLVTAVRHILQSQGVFQTVLEITKDSSGASYIDLRK